MKKKKVTATEKFESTEIKQATFNNEDYQKVTSFFIVLAIVLVLLGCLYYFNGNLVTKDMKEDKSTTTTVPSYDETLILADNIFNVSDKEYMVLIYDSSDTEKGFLYNGLYNGYRGTKVIYGVDLANKMNSSHFDATLENENTKPTKASEIVVSGPRLLVIKDKTVIEYISDSTTITEKLRAK